jgi:dihydropteroate synthase
MQSNCHYDDLEAAVLAYFMERIKTAESCGIKDIIVDPGFGFSKDTKQNFELLNRIDQLSIFNSPILVGISRKSMIYKTLKIEPKDALNGTTVLNTIALLKGANILRVHDVKEAIETITLVAML